MLYIVHLATFVCSAVFYFIFFVALDYLKTWLSCALP